MALCQPVDFLFAKRRLYVPAAIGAGSAIDSGPHAPRNLEDALVNLLRLESALALQECSEFPVLVFFLPRALADLDKIEAHGRRASL